MTLVLLGCIWTTRAVLAADAAPITATGTVYKVLPLLLNLEGHDATSPSLFDRDAYQAYLRLHPKEISGIRYDVLWRARGTGTNATRLRVELRAVGPDGSPRVKTLETPVSPGRFRHWAELPLLGDDYVKLGRVVAWRATLWSGDQMLGTQQSFLW